MSDQFIGVMDSGVGGFSTCEELRKVLPKESILYYADLLYLPYGEKTDEFISERTRAICTHLKKMGAKAIVIACNTASTAYLRNLEAFAHIQIPIFDVITYTLQHIKENLTNPSLFTILATGATTRSQVYQKLLAEFYPSALIKPIATLEWASLIESFPLDSPEVREGVSKYIPNIEDIPSNNVILACTHYHYLESLLRNSLPHARFFSSSTPVVLALKKELEKMGHLSSETSPSYHLQTSKTTESFQRMANRTFGECVLMQVTNI